VNIDFIIGPLELADHPKRAAHGDQHPEEAPPPVRRPCIQKQAGIGQEWHEALHEIAKVLSGSEPGFSDSDTVE